MSTYAIGDIQGCYRDFKKLLKQMNFNKKKDTLWLAGDLVNKGPNSLDVIKYIMDLDTKAISVLGNHDFYLIASYFQAKTWPNKNKNFEEILSDKDSNEIIKWLRQQKLVYKDPKLEYILVHAGIYPKWDLKDTFLMASNIEKLLKSKNCKAFVETLWSNIPNLWHKKLSDKDKLIFSTNAFTRMRYLKEDMSLDFKIKENPEENTSSTLTPWFEFDNKIYDKYKVIIGHWSTLGFRETKKIVSIDTGCVWGNKLTGIEILKNKKIKKFQVKC